MLSCCAFSAARPPLQLPRIVLLDAALPRRMSSNASFFASIRRRLRSSSRWQRKQRRKQRRLPEIFALQTSWWRRTPAGGGTGRRLPCVAGWSKRGVENRIPHLVPRHYFHRRCTALAFAHLTHYFSITYTDGPLRRTPLGGRVPTRMIQASKLSTKKYP